jgi:hypothetical protein
VDFDAGFLINRVIKEEDLYVYNMHNKVEKHFSVSIAPVRSRDDSLVYFQIEYFNNGSCVFVRIDP